MQKKFLQKIVFAILFFFAAFFTNNLWAQVIYVDSASTGGLNNGTSWADAYTDFKTGVTAAASGQSVWVAKGTYQPGSSASFNMKNGVAIYGGFAGNETSLSSRNWLTNTTILEGNGNSVISNNGINSNAILDGFTITGGNGNGGGMYNTNSSPTLTNLIIIKNTTPQYGAGGGMYNNNSSPVITNAQFIQNTVGPDGDGGAGIFNYLGAPKFTNVLISQNDAGFIGEAGGVWDIQTSAVYKNVTFYQNTAGIEGGGLIEDHSSSTITNSVFSGNACPISEGGAIVLIITSLSITNTIFINNSAINGDGGAISCDASSPIITNSTFIGNSAYEGAAVTNNQGAPVYNNCVFWGNHSNSGADIYNYQSSSVFNYNYAPIALGGTGNITGSSNPFVNSANPAGADGILGTADDGLQLARASVAFNMGSNTYISATDTVDIAGNKRINYQTVDMGAFEYQGPVRWYVDSASLAGTNNGTNWTNAFTTFQQATNIARSGDSIWVAKGTYQPPINTAYAIDSNLNIYGGFVGNENKVTARNWITNHSILSGNNSGVIINTGVNNKASLDGFIITNGSNVARGAGLYNINSSPLITNCTFSANYASSEGGAIYQDGGTLNILHDVFSQNKAAAGGAIRAYTISGGSYPNVSIINNIFYKDTATGDDAAAVSLVMGSGTDTVINNVFAKNSAIGNNGNGAALVQENGNSSFIVNNTFYGDTAAVNSGAIRFKSGGSNRYVYNNLFYENFNGTDNTDISVEAGTNITAQGNNTLGTTNPMFVNESNLPGADGIWATADDGLQLTGCSPAINVGSNVTDTITKDIATQVRIFNNTMDAGAYEYQSLPDGTSLALNNDTTTQTIYPGAEALITTGACRIIAKVLPDGVNPLSGTVTSKAYIDPTIQTYLGAPYMQRHLDITPAANASISTAAITLFATQAEFDAYNVASTVKLPTGPGDATGIANLNVVQFHGTSSSGTPGTYTPGTTAIIDPSDATIVWNIILSRWEVTFDVSGFSGFIIIANGATPLSLNLLSFTGTLVNRNAQLEWQTANELNTDHFEIEKSIDGAHFDSLTTVKAIGSGNNTYSIVDAQTQKGDNYYRLKSVNNDGSFAYSNIVLVQVGSDGNVPFLVYPNPASKTITAEYDLPTANAVINIYNLDGQKASSIPTNNQIKIPIDVSHLAAGSYIIQYISDKATLMNKFIKAN
jgi:hypothetical protein